MVVRLPPHHHRIRSRLYFIRSDRVLLRPGLGGHRERSSRWWDRPSQPEKPYND